MLRVRTAVALDEGFKLKLGLTDGSERIVDVTSYLRGPIFEPVRVDRAFFRSVTVDPVLGSIGWPNGADIDPDVLLLKRRPASEEVDVSR
jgi:Protein of unknown function (DUF2442)